MLSAAYLKKWQLYILLKMSKYISYSEIPTFLKNADLFKDLNADDDSAFLLPFYKKDDIIESLYDLFVYFALIDFCSLEDKYISFHIYEYVFVNRAQIRKHANEMTQLIIFNYAELQYLVEIGDDAAAAAYSDVAAAGATASEDAIAAEIKYSKDKVHFCLVNSYFNCFKILIDRVFAWDEDTIILAITHNKLEYLKFLYNSCGIFGYNNTFPWSYHTINAAIDSNNIECLKYIFDNNCINALKIPENTFCNRALIFKQYHILDYLQENGFTWNCDYFIQLELSNEFSYKKRYKYRYENLIMQNIVNDIIFGRVKYELPPLTLNEIIAILIHNQEKINIAIEKILITSIWENYRFDYYIIHNKLSMQWISAELNYITKDFINP